MGTQGAANVEWQMYNQLPIAFKLCDDMHTYAGALTTSAVHDASATDSTPLLSIVTSSACRSTSIACKNASVTSALQLLVRNQVQLIDDVTNVTGDGTTGALAHFPLVIVQAPSLQVP
jgi:hypothetical protein